MTTKSKVITVEIKQVYGRQLIYPICDNAQSFALLTNTRTFTPGHVAVIRKLGFDVKVLQPTIEV